MNRLRGQIDYSSPREMRRAAERTVDRRGGNDHEWVIGAFVLVNSVIVDSQVILHALYCGPAYNREETLTTDATRFSRWRTKQAAWSYLRIRPHLQDLRVIHLGRLDVLSSCRR